MSYQFHGFAPQTASISSLLHSRAKFDAGRAFDLEDDLEFCPSLLTDEDLHAAYASDHLSTSSGSPDSSPLQSQLRPNPSPAGAPAAAVATSTSTMLGQLSPAMSPGRTSGPRVRRAIEIVDPNTGLRVASPPLSSPAKLPYNAAHASARRAWS
ncbi:hypothetical protein V1514DRAFT_343977 [Lipomyces japonicus]|uniref:uncharacterized protein n=1 Tax=Lipomyces japonicus TaxID=56871 RepID=UPI0034CFD5E5